MVVAFTCRERTHRSERIIFQPCMSHENGLLCSIYSPSCRTETSIHLTVSFLFSTGRQSCGETNTTSLECQNVTFKKALTIAGSIAAIVSAATDVSSLFGNGGKRKNLKKATLRAKTSTNFSISTRDMQPKPRHLLRGLP